MQVQGKFVVDKNMICRKQRVIEELPTQEEGQDAKLEKQWEEGKTEQHQTQRNENLSKCTDQVQFSKPTVSCNFSSYSEADASVTDANIVLKESKEVKREEYEDSERYALLQFGSSSKIGRPPRSNYVQNKKCKDSSELCRENDYKSNENCISEDGRRRGKMIIPISTKMITFYPQSLKAQLFATKMHNTAKEYINDTSNHANKSNTITETLIDDCVVEIERTEIRECNECTNSVDDHDEMTAETTYITKNNPRPEAGRYVLDPNNEDFSNPHYSPSVFALPQRTNSRSRSSTSAIHCTNQIPETVKCQTSLRVPQELSSNTTNSSQPSALLPVIANRKRNNSYRQGVANVCNLVNTTTSTSTSSSTSSSSYSSSCYWSSCSSQSTETFSSKQQTNENNSNSDMNKNGDNSALGFVREGAESHVNQSLLPQVHKKREKYASERNVVCYPVVMPRYRMSAASLFFPIHNKKRRDDTRVLSGHKQSSAAAVVNWHCSDDRSELTLSSVEIQKNNLNRMCLYKIGPCAVAFKVVLNAFEAAGMRHTNSNTLFNVLWAKRATPYTLASLTPYQKVNHFPGTWGLGRKDSLAYNINRMRRYFGEDKIDITPASFIIPRQKDELLWEATRNPPSANKPLIYILKPCASSCGRGIELCHGIPNMPRGGKQVVCQRYIGNPLLINGKKFDLRLYCVVTGFDPLRIFLFKEGLVRFAASTYTGPDQDLDNILKHLTNYSIGKTVEREGKMDSRCDEHASDNDNNISNTNNSRKVSACRSNSKTTRKRMTSRSVQRKRTVSNSSKKSENITKNSSSSIKLHLDTNETPTWQCQEEHTTSISVSDINDTDSDVLDIKWSLTQLKEHLTQHHPLGAAVWDKIERECEDVVIKSFLSIESEVVKRIRAECADKTGRNCFELFGLDLMVDDELKVRLIEVNIMPSLATGTPLDKTIKSRMLAHLLTLIRVIPHRRDALSRAMSDKHNSEFLPHGALPTRPETIYKFGKHPNGSALMVEHPLLHAFNKQSDAHSMLSLEECLMLVEAEEEMECSGDFRRIFPNALTLQNYLPLFTSGVRRNTFLLCSAAMMHEKIKCIENIGAKKF